MMTSSPDSHPAPCAFSWVTSFGTSRCPLYCASYRLQSTHTGDRPYCLCPVRQRHRAIKFWYSDLEAVWGRVQGFWSPRWRESFYRQPTLFKPGIPLSGEVKLLDNGSGDQDPSETAALEGKEDATGANKYSPSASPGAAGSSPGAEDFGVGTRVKAWGIRGGTCMLPLDCSTEGAGPDAANSTSTASAQYCPRANRSKSKTPESSPQLRPSTDDEPLPDLLDLDGPEETVAPRADKAGDKKATSGAAEELTWSPWEPPVTQETEPELGPRQPGSVVCEVTDNDGSQRFADWFEVRGPTP